MSGPIAIDSAADIRSVAAPLLASLPLSYAPATQAGHGAVVVGGTGDWSATVARALDNGAVAVIVVHPESAQVEAAQLEALQTRHALIIIDTRWAANPVVDTAAGAFSAALPRGLRVECHVHLSVGSALETALTDQLTLVRALLGPVTDVRMLTRSSRGYAAEGHAAGHPIDLSLVCTDAVPESASVRLLTGDGSVELIIPSGVTAQPARLTVTGPAGAQLSPTLYESGHRATWRRAYRILTDRQSPTDLAVFSGDHHQALRALTNAEG